MSLSNLLKPLRITSSLFYPDAQIVFVCGKDLSKEDSRRKIFMQYAEKNLHKFNFLLAEKVFATKMHDDDVDLLTIESTMSDYADCIIIILESESAFAELGAFSFSDELAKKIIVINDILHKDSPSFINLGPIKKISQQRDGFGNPIHVNMKSFLSCAKMVEQKLSKIERKKAFRKDLNTYDNFKKFSKERMLLLYDIVGFLSPVTQKELIAICEDIYGKHDFSFLRTDISILSSLDMICACHLIEDEKRITYLTANGNFPRFLKTEMQDRITTRSNVLLHYRKKSIKRLQLLAQ